MIARIAMSLFLVFIVIIMWNFVAVMSDASPPVFIKIFMKDNIIYVTTFVLAIVAMISPF